jgi:glutathione S-transferase
MEGKIKLGYWNLRGRGQVLRLLLAYTGQDWEEVTYKDASQWFGIGDKTKLGFDFPNLPYLINGDFKLTESIAIARYIIRKSNKPELLGKNVEDEAKIEMILSLLDDIFSPTFSMFFSPNHQADKVRLFDNKLKVKIQELVHFIGNKDTCIGYLTLADFRLAEASYYFEKLYP